MAIQHLAVSKPSVPTAALLAHPSGEEVSTTCFDESANYRSNHSSSKLVGALRAMTAAANANVNTASANGSTLFTPFPIAFHPSDLMQLYGLHADPLPFSRCPVEYSTDCASKLPLCAVLYSLFGTSSRGGDGYTSAGSTHRTIPSRAAWTFPSVHTTPKGSLTKVLRCIGQATRFGIH